MSRLDLDPNLMEVDPEYDQEATASRVTNPDTHTTTRSTPEGDPHMTALHNRALALKLAVENYALTPSSDNACETYSLVTDDGVVDETLLTGVFTLADRFVTYLGADEPATSVPSGDSAPAAPPVTADDTEYTVQAIRLLLQRSRAALGGRATEAALGQLDALRSATRGQGRAAVINTAVSYVDDAGRREFGSAVADRLIAGLRDL